jgi:hypothetical protein
MVTVLIILSGSLSSFSLLSTARAGSVVTILGAGAALSTFT